MLETPFRTEASDSAGNPAIRNDVLLAQDGWLFLNQGAQGQFEYLLGKQTPDPRSVGAFWSNLKSRAQFCAERGWPYLHIVFPSKPVVMARFLPEELRDQVRSLYLRSYLPASPPGAAAQVLYPVEQLRALDATDLPFLETDTHMSALGSAAVVQAALTRWGLGYDLDDYFQREDGTYLGDLSAMLGRQDRQPHVALRDRGLGCVVYDNRRFLGSNSNHVTLIHSPRSVTQQRLAVVGDSFFHQSLRFLAPLFRDILYLRGPGFHADTLARFAPDAVMTGNAERYLAKVRPDAAVPDILAALARKPDYRPDETFQGALAAQLAGEAPRAPAETDEVAALKRRLAEQEARLTTMGEELKRKDDELQALRKRKDARIQALRQQNQRQEKRRAEVERLLDQIQRSTSWQVTNPLRRILAGLRRLR